MGRMPDDRTRELFLIDGNSLAYRAFFALPESIATSKGMPTNAIFGFASMLVKILTEYGQQPTIVAWDAGMSGREQEYGEYKAQRKARPDLLAEQWPHLEPLVEAFGYANVKVQGYEADDVIATLAATASQEGIPVMAVTGDRDALQLVEDGVSVMTTSRGITDTRIYDRQAVIDRYGIPPELVPDFIGLKGDTSDNIPGVPGIGDKTAAQLLQEFGDLDTVLESIDKISGAKRKENLATHAEDARLSKRLATAKRDVPIDLDLGGLMEREPDRAMLREAFREFELRDPLRRLEEALGGEQAAPREEAAQAVELTAVEAELKDLAAHEGATVAVAVDRPPPFEQPEGDAAQATLPAAAGDADEPPRFAATAGGGTVLVGRAPTLRAIGGALTGVTVCAHDWKSIANLGRASGDAAGQVQLGFDTMLAAYLLDPAGRSYSLVELAAERDLGADVKGLEGSDNAFLRGLAERAALTLALASAQADDLERDGLAGLLHEVELPLVDVLIEMEAAGIKLDTVKLAEVGRTYSKRIAQLEREIWDLAGEEFTIGSPQQLAQILFEKLELTKKRRGKTGFSTDARVLQAIRGEHEIVAKVEAWRELAKLKSTYLDALPQLVDRRTGRLHTTFNQAATTTGRLSSTNPNLQNIPIRTEEGREIRACFVADEGARLLSADYSQVELRILAHVAGEETLREVLESGEDVHAVTAAEMFGQGAGADPGLRSKAKMINFGIAYGLSSFGLADRLQIPIEEAADVIDRYFNRFPKIREFIERTIGSATAEGLVTTLLGRRRAIPELRDPNPQTRSLGERLAVNTVIQGTAADIVKVAMVRCRDRLREAGRDARLVLQIHDELLFEVPEGQVDAIAEVVRTEMTGAFALQPPLAVDIGIGSDWLEAK
jgi:DNA polymerase I